MLKSNFAKSNSLQSSHVQSLMDSIEQKLHMLANDDIDQSYSLNHPMSHSAFNYESDFNNIRLQLSPATIHKKAKEEVKLQIGDLETSFRKQVAHLQSPNQTGKLNESRVVARINQMEQSYIKQITQLNYKLVHLEDQHQQLQEKYKKMQQDNLKHMAQCCLKQKEYQKQMESQLNQIKMSLLDKMREESEQQIQKYLDQIDDLNKLLEKERKDKKHLENEIKILQFEKNSFEQLYSQLIQSHKQIIKADLNQNSHLKQRQINQYWMKNHSRKQGSPISLADKRKKKKRLNSYEGKPLKKQQLIPFLAKGIEELKQKLNIK